MICPNRLFDFLGCLFILFLFAIPIFLYTMKLLNQKGILIMFIMNIISLVVIIPIHIPSCPELTVNGRRFLKLFEKNHFPYPKSKMVSNAQYEEMMVLWC